MKNVLFTLCIALLSLGSIPVRAQKVPSAALRADLDTLYRTLQEVHVDLFAVAGRAKLDSMVAALDRELASTDSVRLRTFYFGLIPIFEAIGDGHTSLPYDGPRWRMPVFPFGVAIPDDSTIQVRHNYLPDSPLPAGSRIDSINGRSAGEIIRRLVTLRPGERMHFRLAMLEEDFFRYYALFYGDTVFRIRTVTPAGAVFRDTVRGVPRIEVWKQESARAREEPFRFDILSDTVALFDFRSMSGEYREQFEPFLDSMFRTLRERRIPNLVIDIRQNSGGNSALGDALMRYLSRKPFTQFGRIVIKHSRQEVEAHMARYRDYYPKRYTDSMILQDREKNTPFGTVSTHPISRKRFIKSRSERERYSGRVWLLTSRYTYSSAFLLSWAFKYFDMGTVVGEETGGVSVSFGDMIMLRMPNCRLPYSVSYKKFYNYGATDDDVHGTLPDYPVPADKALDYTLRLIRQNSARAK